MTLTVLDSGSRANGYVLHDDREALVLECGCTYSKCLEAIGFNRRKIVGALVTHEHGDHCRYIEQYFEAAIPTLTSKGTAENWAFKRPVRPRIVECFKTYELGGFKVMAFDTQHDSAEPIGFLIQHDSIGVLLFATDTYYLKYKFDDLTQVMIECNYDKGILERNVETGVVKPFVKDRIKQSHMSLETTISTLKANDISRVNNVVLLHLSSNNSDSDMFKERIEQEIGKVVTIARKGVSLSFNKEMI